jgi:hypothetical protein
VKSRVEGKEAYETGLRNTIKEKEGEKCIRKRQRKNRENGRE